MKRLHLALAFFTSACFAQEPVTDAAPDPTRASPRMKSALMSGGSAIPAMNIKGIVLAGGKDGAVMFDIPGAGTFLARPGAPFGVVLDGEARKLVMTRITADGIVMEAPEQKETVLIPTFGPIGERRQGLPGDVDYVEFRDMPLIEALRMLSDQTGQNYSASVNANKIPVNAMLRNVRANSVVEEICKSHNLWFKRDEVTNITRIMSVTEFERDLVGFREEQTEVFTLKFPNVTEVATAIADLFGDRVQLSLGAEDADEDARQDLESRFDRFDVLNQRNQTAGGLNGGNFLGNNVNGFFSNGGSSTGFSTNNYNGEGGGYGGRGGNRNSSYSRRRNTEDNDRARVSKMEEDFFQNLTPDQAQRVERALSSTKTSDDSSPNIEALRKRPTSIYVTASRRNSMVVVRTADARAMDDIRVLVKRMDVQTPLVLLEVKVYSVELGREMRSAFDYQFSNGSVAASFTGESLGTPLTGGAIVGGGMNSSDMTFTIVSNNFRARMQLLEEKNKVKTLATPMLLTANNEVSRLFLGEERPLVRNINSQTIITDNNVATTPNTTTEFRPVGNTLLITPNINSDRTVTIRMLQENSFISPNGATIPIVTNRAGSNGVQDVKVDVVGTRSVNGTFVAKDGMAVAIGGLIEEVDSDRRAQIPLLGNIPGVGVLFRRQEKAKVRRELIIMIRPHVISTPADGERISKSLLNQLAPDSANRLVEEGFLPELPAPQPAPVPRVISAPSAKSVKKVKK